MSDDRFDYEGYSDVVTSNGQQSRSFKGKGRVISCDRIIERLTYTTTDLTDGNGDYFYTCELELKRVFVGTGLLSLDNDELQAVGEPLRGADIPCKVGEAFEEETLRKAEEGLREVEEVLFEANVGAAISAVKLVKACVAAYTQFLEYLPDSPRKSAVVERLKDLCN